MHRSFLLVWILLFALTGCEADSIESHWQRTHEICAFEQLPWSASYQQPPMPSQACIDAILDDFGADEAALLAADDLESVDVFLDDSDQAVWHTRIGGLLSGARALHVFDLGSVEGVTRNPDTSWAYVDRVHEMAEKTGHIRLDAVLYDYTATRTQSVVPGWDDHLATMEVQEGELVLHGHMRGAPAAAVLVHEARHADGEYHLECPFSSEPDCDPDLDGAYGFHLATAARMHALSNDPVVDIALEGWMAASRKHILSP